MVLLVAGGAGFIGSHFVRLMLSRDPQARVVVLDALTYAGNLANLADVWQNSRFRFVPGRIQDPTVVRGVIEAEGITHLVNFAAESHNDRSLLESGSFIQTDVYGVHVLLEAVRDLRLQRFVHVSTDEVYGSIGTGAFTEQSPLEPNTPYSASKAGGDLQCRVHHIAFGTPVIVTRGANTYGPYQYPEKLIPFFAVRLLEGKKVPLYGDGQHVRSWLHVEDHTSGIAAVLEAGLPGEIYNIAADVELPNREVVDRLLRTTGRDESLVKPIPDPRGAAHDRRYAMTCEPLRSLGWRARRAFDEGLEATVAWYRSREDWWRPILDRADYREFIARFYGPSLGEDL